ncbi:hypothetical protein [Oxynema sp. CENA135]|nr:hypothetical protein [Oxynema sp. CENA135]
MYSFLMVVDRSKLGSGRSPVTPGFLAAIAPDLPPYKPEGDRP